MIQQGDVAPAFDLPGDDGNSVTLAELRGRRVVLYFYPKDDTPGCTIQACALRDDLPRFEALDAVVLGVSPDSVASHVKFRDKYGLSFALLADEDHSVAEAYGVWKEKSFLGKRYWGVERSTFVIDAHGRIAQVWRKVKPRGHSEMLAAYLER